MKKKSQIVKLKINKEKKYLTKKETQTSGIDANGYEAE